MIKWSTNDKERTIQVQTAMQILGFEFPSTVEENDRWDEMFKGYPYQHTIEEIDFEKIWNDEDQHFNFDLSDVITCAKCFPQTNEAYK